ncbi:hypothetical protein ON010_g11417 [Phytophthora cinnamomi]|nr:hypothetical protein ON010_g11417 [Phytophthora cinnamomi]
MELVPLESKHLPEAIEAEGKHVGEDPGAATEGEAGERRYQGRKDRGGDEGTICCNGAVVREGWPGRAGAAEPHRPGKRGEVLPGY